MLLYEEFLNFGRERFDKFFENVNQFPNSLNYTEFNETCYIKMFIENKSDDITTVKTLKERIEKLESVCKKCADYYTKKRNESVKGLDVQLGKLFEDVLIDFLNSKGLKSSRGDLKNKKYPDCMLLAKDRGVLAYFEVKYHNAPFIYAKKIIERYCYEGSITLDYKKIQRQLEIIDSDIDRPVFYIHIVDYPCLKGIFYETSEQVKANIAEGIEYEREERTGDYIKLKKIGYTRKVYSPLLEMGTFDELFETFRKLQLEGVSTNEW